MCCCFVIVQIGEHFMSQMFWDDQLLIIAFAVVVVESSCQDSFI